MPKKGPFILASNHRYDLDAFLISYALDAPLTWVAADFLQRLPVTNILIWLFGMLTVSKGKGSNYANIRNIRNIVTCLQEGGNIGIFTEGMDYLIAADFSKPMADFYPGFAKIACMLDMPVYPVSIIPQKEWVHRYPIPKAIRRLFHVSTELQEIPLRNTYLSVTLHFGPVIRPDPKLRGAERVKDMMERVRNSIERKLRFRRDSAL